MDNKKHIAKHYGESYIEAASLGLYDHCKFLSSQKEFDHTYISKKRENTIIMSSAQIGDVKTFSKALNNLIDNALISEKKIGSDNPVTMLNLITRAAMSGNMAIIELITDSIDLFEDSKHYQYNVNSALRYAGEKGHAKLFDYLISKGAQANAWHVLRWTAASGPGNTYRKMLKANDLEPKTKRKDVIAFCEKIFCKPGWSCVNIDELKDYIDGKDR